MKTLLIFTLFLGACSVVPAYTTKHGIEVYDNSTTSMPTKAEVELVTTQTVRYLGGAKKLDGVKLTFTNDFIKIPRYSDDNDNEESYYLVGVQSNIMVKSIIVSIVESCLAKSKLLHELAHMIHDQKIPDWWHDDKEFWAKIRVLEDQIVKDLCPTN